MRVILLIVIIGLIGCKQSSRQVIDPPVLAPMTAEGLGELYQYYHANPSTQEQREENTLIGYLADHNYQAQRTVSGVYIVMKEEGNGEGIKWGDPIETHYRGTFLNGEQFDSSYKRGKPLSFRVGQMIPGWNEALLTRKKGDRFMLLIPSHMGYGKRGFPGAVPPDANLLFEIEILNET